MPDITMCLSKDCSRRNACYRYKAKPDTYQSYSDFYHICSNAYNGKDNFIEILPDDVIVEKMSNE